MRQGDQVALEQKAEAGRAAVRALHVPFRLVLRLSKPAALGHFVIESLARIRARKEGNVPGWNVVYAYVLASVLTECLCLTA